MNGRRGHDYDYPERPRVACTGYQLPLGTVQAQHQGRPCPSCFPYEYADEHAKHRSDR